MQKILASFLAAATIAGSFVIAPPAAEARNRFIVRQGQGVHAFQGRRNFAYRGNYNARRYGGWNQGRRYGWRNRGWGGRRYYGYDNYDRGDEVGAGIAGLAAGVIIGSVLSHRSHAAPGSCAARFQSYNRATGTYLGYDGLRHPCP